MHCVRSTDVVSTWELRYGDLATADPLKYAIKAKYTAANVPFSVLRVCPNFANYVANNFTTASFPGHTTNYTDAVMMYPKLGSSVSIQISQIALKKWQIPKMHVTVIGSSIRPKQILHQNGHHFGWRCMCCGFPGQWRQWLSRHHYERLLALGGLCRYLLGNHGQNIFECIPTTIFQQYFDGSKTLLPWVMINNQVVGYAETNTCTSETAASTGTKYFYKLSGYLTELTGLGDFFERVWARKYIRVENCTTL